MPCVVIEYYDAVRESFDIVESVPVLRPPPQRLSNGPAVIRMLSIPLIAFKQSANTRRAHYLMRIFLSVRVRSLGWTMA